jgi:hypothetical protein
MNTRRTLAVVVLLVVLAGCGSDGGSQSPTSTTAATHTITGTYTLVGTQGDDFLNSPDVGCWGTGGFGDIDEGMAVTVTNEADVVIGNGALGPGEVTDDGCRFYFRAPNVPVAKFYRVEAGRRGKVNYSYEQMQAAGWNIGLTLG